MLLTLDNSKQNDAHTYDEYSLPQRHREGAGSASEFNLCMPRRDIANYLNMAPKTISRLFKRLQESGAINLNRRALVINDMPKLRAMAGCQP